MQLPRRNFIKTGTLTAVSAGLAASGARFAFSQDRGSNKKGDYEVPITAEGDAVFMFTAATFLPYVGGIFQAPNALGYKVPLTLEKVITYKKKEETKLQSKEPRPSDSFSLVFSSSERLPQFTSIHKVSHPALGEFDLFLTPNKTKHGTMTYEAVFNHIH
jgi:uncharacterized protein DUF6916